MDSKRFDHLTQTLGNSATRRAASRLFASGAMAGLAGWSGPRDDGEAKRKRKKKRPMTTAAPSTPAPPTLSCRRSAQPRPTIPRASASLQGSFAAAKREEEARAIRPIRSAARARSRNRGGYAFRRVASAAPPKKAAASVTPVRPAAHPVPAGPMGSAHRMVPTVF